MIFLYHGTKSKAVALLRLTNKVQLADKNKEEISSHPCMTQFPSIRPYRDGGMLTKSLKVTLLPRLYQQSHFQALEPVHISFVQLFGSVIPGGNHCKAAKGSSQHRQQKESSLSFGYDAVTEATGMHRA